MAILGVLSVALEIPDITPGVKFYTDAGLEAEADGHRVRFHCRGQARACLELLGGAPRKRLHHVRLRAERLPALRAAALAGGASEIPPPEGVGVARKPPVFLQAGDVVRCEIDGVGAIENRIAPRR